MTRTRAAQRVLVIALAAGACVGSDPAVDGAKGGEGVSDAGQSPDGGGTEGGIASVITVNLPADPYVVEAGKSVDVTVTVTRTAFDGAFELRPAGASAGVTLPTRLVQAGETSVGFTITTEASAKHGARSAPIAAFDLSGQKLLWTGNVPLLVRGAPGALDTGFGSDGNGGASLDFSAAASVLQADGKLVIVGQSAQAPAGGRIARFDAAGVLDTAFGDQGVVKSALQGQGNGAQWTAVAIDAMGRVVVVGSAFAGGGASVHQQTLVARFLANGTPDTGFGIGGFATNDIPAHDGERPVAVATLPDGSMLVAGDYLFSAGVGRGFMIKVAATGVRDTAFGVPELSQPYPAGQIRALTVAGDRIYAVGGSIVGWFGLDGALKVGVELSTDFANSAMTHIAQDASGRLITAGVAPHDAVSTTLSARWIPAAAGAPPALTLDVPWGVNSEGTHEEVVCDTSTNYENAQGVVVQPDRKSVILAGARNCPTPAGRGVVLYRYLDNGDRDLDFGTAGETRAFLAGRDVFPAGIHWTPSSQLLVVGITGGVEGRTDLLRFWP